MLRRTVAANLCQDNLCLYYNRSPMFSQMLVPCHKLGGKVCHVVPRGKIEGLAKNVHLHPLQQSAIDHDAIQCGFCTPGWLLSAKVLLDHRPAPTAEEVRAAIAGNLCRCAGYKKIEDSILAVAGKKIE